MHSKTFELQTIEFFVISSMKERFQNPAYAYCY